VELNLLIDQEKYVVINISKVKSIAGTDNDFFNMSFSPLERLKRILAVCLEDKAHFPASKVLKTNHLEYFANYLKYYDPKVGFNVKTIIVEKQYMSLSYLKDFSKYYSIGYPSYNKYCKRIHFFQKEFEKPEFENFLTSKDDENQSLVSEIKQSYLGHIVAKPLPNSLIGATLIRCYDEFFANQNDQEQKYLTRNRHYFALRNYSVNLFGQNISFKTLVFQEQDKAVSACATVAIWMCIHKISDLFKTTIPAPIEITESAGLDENSGRNIPNQGLLLNQIIKAIDSIQANLVSEIFDAKDIVRVAISRQCTPYKIIKPWKIKRYIYAYLRLEIPILLGYNIVKLNGNHLVTITGYRYAKNIEEKNNEQKFYPSSTESMIRTEADKIVRLYSHDDQLGPFSKIGFDCDGFSNYLQINWRGKDKFNLAIAKLVVIPIIDFIRIKYTDIELFASQFQEFTQTILFSEYDESLDNLFIWDIYIVKSNEYKQQIRNTRIESKLEHLQNSYPQYIWIATLKFVDSNDSINIIDFVFDATDTPKSMNLFNLLFYDEMFKSELCIYFTNESNSNLKKYTRDIFYGMNYLEKIKRILIPC